MDASIRRRPASRPPRQRSTGSFDRSVASSAAGASRALALHTDELLALKVLQACTEAAAGADMPRAAPGREGQQHCDCRQPSAREATPERLPRLVARPEVGEGVDVALASG